MRVLIAGCGDVGLRLGRRLVAKGHEVFGLRRRAEAIEGGIVPVPADLAEPASLAGLPPDLDHVVFLPAPDERSEAAYTRVYREGLAHLAEALTGVDARWLVVSSTAVYGQDDGSRVDEASETDPAGFNGRVLLGMERDARALGATVARLSGIYGPGRDWLIRTARAGGSVQARPPNWTNRVHADDAAAALDHLLTLPRREAVYLVSDDTPAPRHEVLAWLAERLGVPAPAFTEVPDGPQGKRCDNARLRGSGFRFTYPDYRAGYARLLEEA